MLSLALNVVFVPTGAIYLVHKVRILNAQYSAPESTGARAATAPAGFISTLDYRWPRRLFEDEPVSPGAVIFLGDSLTAGGMWQEVWRATLIIPVLNRGLIGDRMEGITARIDEVTRHRPSKLFVMIGINDIKFEQKDPLALVNQFRALVDKVVRASPNTKIYLQSLLPVWDTSLNRSVRQVNLSLASIADNHHVYYVDLNSIMSDANGLLRRELSFDGVHLRAAGYEEWRKAIWPLVYQ